MELHSLISMFPVFNIEIKVNLHFSKEAIAQALKARSPRQDLVKKGVIVDEEQFESVSNPTYHYYNISLMVCRNLSPPLQLLSTFPAILPTRAPLPAPLIAIQSAALILLERKGWATLGAGMNFILVYHLLTLLQRLYSYSLRP